MGLAEERKSISQILSSSNIQPTFQVETEIKRKEGQLETESACHCN